MAVPALSLRIFPVAKSGSNIERKEGMRRKLLPGFAEKSVPHRENRL